jgi:hypothetical protein
MKQHTDPFIIGSWNNLEHDTPKRLYRAILDLAAHILTAAHGRFYFAVTIWAFGDMNAGAIRFFNS